jgi:hypothetical protein
MVSVIRPFNLTPAVQKPQITRITQIVATIADSVQTARLPLGHPPGKSSLQHNIFFIRENP